MASPFSGKAGRMAAVEGNRIQQAGLGRTLGALRQGYDTARDAYGRAGSYYSPYASRYNRGASMYSNALGLNGAAGSKRAEAAFRAGPGYGFTMDQGLQALQRARAAGGMLASGNAETDQIKFAQGLADQEYGNWVNRLADMDARGVGVAGSRAGLQTGLGQLGMTYGGQVADAQRGYTDAVTGNTMSGMMAGQQAAGNRFGALMGGLQLGASLLGGLGGMGGIGGALGGLGGAGGAAKPMSVNGSGLW